MNLIKQSNYSICKSELLTPKSMFEDNPLVTRRHHLILWVFPNSGNYTYYINIKLFHNN